jgi:hypothetical protein
VPQERPERQGQEEGRGQHESRLRDRGDHDPYTLQALPGKSLGILSDDFLLGTRGAISR